MSLKKKSLWCLACSTGSHCGSGFSVLQRLLHRERCQSSHFTTYPRQSPEGAGRQKSLVRTNCFLYQCWPATLLVAPAHLHLGACLIPLLCHLRSVDVLNFHPENYDKGNKLCEEEIHWACGFKKKKSPAWIHRQIKVQAQFVKIIPAWYYLRWHDFIYFQLASGRWGLKR